MNEMPPINQGENGDNERQAEIKALDEKIAKVNKEISDLQERKDKEKNHLVARAFGQQISIKINERAGYMMRKRELLSKD